MTASWQAKILVGELSTTRNSLSEHASKSFHEKAGEWHSRVCGLATAAVSGLRATLAG
jgi:hypothetical protein